MKRHWTLGNWRYINLDDDDDDDEEEEEEEDGIN